MFDSRSPIPKERPANAACAQNAGVVVQQRVPGGGRTHRSTVQLLRGTDCVRSRKAIDSAQYKARGLGCSTGWPSMATETRVRRREAQHLVQGWS